MLYGDYRKQQFQIIDDKEVSLVGQFVKKTVIGLILGFLLTAIICNSQAMAAEIVVISYLWGIGTSFSFRHHLENLQKMINPGLKLSVISFLSFRNGFMGSFPILIYIAYCLLLGWIHGLVMFFIDVIGLFI